MTAVGREDRDPGLFDDLPVVDRPLLAYQFQRHVQGCLPANLFEPAGEEAVLREQRLLVEPQLLARPRLFHAIDITGELGWLEGVREPLGLREAKGSVDEHDAADARMATCYELQRSRAPHRPADEAYVHKVERVEELTQIRCHCCEIVGAIGLIGLAHPTLVVGQDCRIAGEVIRHAIEEPVRLLPAVNKDEGRPGIATLRGANSGSVRERREGHGVIRRITSAPATWSQRHHLNPRAVRVRDLRPPCQSTHGQSPRNSQPWSWCSAPRRRLPRGR